MEAAKRMYDNSYSERQETASLAKAYLNDAPKEKPQAVTSKKKGSIICNAFGIVTSIVYCLVILGLLLMPLIRETQLAQLKIEEDSYKREIARLEQAIEEVKYEFEQKRDMVNIEQEAKEKLGLVRKKDGKVETVKTSRYYSLDDARDAYYNTGYDFSASEDKGH
ncbi:hypothetical protein EZV73_21720 [Acidaminobacter sp. JC074]|uniref:hypothetical protein n=1 Tax=Acidaminobacter sp. JC074 TaxID=2530199 RepID=UPI001F0E54E6|nr:hypothetical protein [Acidaminobacter sp. JC074]MCH4890215.1 hypothetical protein [Acidaminobacter sp. JC074]